MLYLDQSQPRKGQSSYTSIRIATAFRALSVPRIVKIEVYCHKFRAGNYPKHSPNPHE